MATLSVAERDSDGSRPRDRAQYTRKSGADAPRRTRDDRVHTPLCGFWSSSFSYAVDTPTLYPLYGRFPSG